MTSEYIYQMRPAYQKNGKVKATPSQKMFVFLKFIYKQALTPTSFFQRGLKTVQWWKSWYHLNKLQKLDDALVRQLLKAAATYHGYHSNHGYLGCHGYLGYNGYDTKSDEGSIWVPPGGKSESGQIVF